MPGGHPKTFADKLQRTAYEYHLKAKTKENDNDSSQKDSDSNKSSITGAPIRIPNGIEETKIPDFIKGICKIFADKGFCDVNFIDNDWLTNEILEQLNQDGLMITGYKACYCEGIEEKHQIYETCVKWEKDN